MSFVLIEEAFEMLDTEDGRFIVGLCGACAARLSKKGMEGRCQACKLTYYSVPHGFATVSSGSQQRTS